MKSEIESEVTSSTESTSIGVSLRVGCVMMIFPRRASKCLGLVPTLRKTSTISSNNKRYLEESELPTLYFQQSLPRLAVPSLRESCRRYLAALKPYVSDEQHLHSSKLAEEFSRENSTAWELNKLLINESRDTSYLSHCVTDMLLRRRKPIALFRNPGFYLKDDPNCNNQLTRAVSFLHAMVCLQNSILDHKLKPDLVWTNKKSEDYPLLVKTLAQAASEQATQVATAMGAVPLDMTEYSHLLGVTRIPKTGKDEHVHYPNARHVVVMRNGHIYSIEVADDNGNPVHPAHLYAALLAVQNDQAPPPDTPLSYLTCQDRDSWAAVRQELISLCPENAVALDKIESALLVLCLDSEDVPSLADSLTAGLHNYGANRWFDKSMQLVVTSRAGVMTNFDHTLVDGRSHLGLLNRAFTHICQEKYAPSSSHDNGRVPEKLKFQLNESLREAIQRSREEFEEICRSFSLRTYMYENQGKNIWDSYRLRPHCMPHLIFQIAYYRRYKVLPTTRQPVSVSSFFHGRTELISPGTAAAKECAKAFESCESLSRDHIISLLRAAVSEHTRLMKEAGNGRGFHRHLEALKCLSEIHGLTLPFLEDPSYVKFTHSVLFPSTANASGFHNAAFAPIVHDGFSVGYRFDSNYLIGTVGSFSSSQSLDLMYSIEQVLHEILKLLES